MPCKAVVRIRNNICQGSCMTDNIMRHPCPKTDYYLAQGININ